MIPAMLAEPLGFSQATALSAVKITADSLFRTRAADDGSRSVTVALPAVISITKALPDARFPNFKGIMAAKKKPLEVLSLSDLGASADRRLRRGRSWRRCPRNPRARRE